MRMLWLTLSGLVTNSELPSIYSSRGLHTKPASLVSSLVCLRNGISAVPPVPCSSNVIPAPSPAFFSPSLVVFSIVSFTRETLAKLIDVSPNGCLRGFLEGRIIYRVTICKCRSRKRLSSATAALYASETRLERG